MKVNVEAESTAAVIADMVDTMKRYTRELERIGQKMINTNDVSLASEALNAVTNCMQNLRLDLLVTRPIREFDRTLFVKFEAERETTRG